MKTDRLAAMRAFVAAADEGSFTAAARRLESTPQAVSKQVAALEADLGWRLIARTTRTMHLTEAGQAYAGRARALLADLDALEDDLRARRTEPAGLLRLTAPVSFAPPHLAGPVAAFLADHPKVSVRMDLIDRAVDLVDEGYDLAVRVGAPGPSTYVVRRLGTVRMAVCAAPAYLARRGTPAHPDDLAQHDAVLDGNLARPDRWRFARGAEVVEARLASRIQVSSADAARAAALAGAGVVLGPTFLLGDDIRAGRLVRLLLDWSAGERALNAVFPAAKGLAPKVRAFVDRLAGAFGSTPPWDAELSFASAPI